MAWLFFLHINYMANAAIEPNSPMMATEPIPPFNSKAELGLSVGVVVPVPELVEVDEVPLPLPVAAVEFTPSGPAFTGPAAFPTSGLCTKLITLNCSPTPVIFAKLLELQTNGHAVPSQLLTAASADFFSTGLMVSAVNGATCVVPAS